METIRIMPDKSSSPVDPRRKKDSTFDRIWNFYYSDKKITLTPKEKRIKDRWEFLWKLMGDILTTSQIVKLYQREFKLSRQAAYIDIEFTKRLFGDSITHDVKVKRSILSEWIMKALKQSYDAKDFEAFEQLLHRYCMINGLYFDDDISDEMIERLQPRTIIITGNPEALIEFENDDN